MEPDRAKKPREEQFDKTESAPRDDGPGEPFVPLPDMTDLADPAASLRALDELPAQSSDAMPTGDSPLNLSEAGMEKLVQQIVDEMAARQTSSDAASPDMLAGVVLRPIEGADTESEEADPIVPHAPGQPSTRPRADETAWDIDRTGGGTPRRGESDGNATPPPRVVVMVQLADAEAILDKERHATATEMAATVEQIADARIKYAEFVKESQRRAADHRLRR